MERWGKTRMSQKKRKVLRIIDTLTIVLIVIQIQSMLAYFTPENFYHYPFKEQLVDSFSLFMAAGWSDILFGIFSIFYPLSRFLVFLASIYAVLAETIGIVKKDLPPKFVGWILLKLLFIALSLVWIDYVLYTIMSM